MHQMEMINRRTWSNPLSRRDYRNSSGFINEGEPGQLRSQLTESGLNSEPLLFSVDGRPLGGEMLVDEEYFHVLARKPLLG